MHSDTTRLANDFELCPMNSTDPASLQNLNDIVLPIAASWWPLAGGWYFLIGLLLIALAWFSYHSIRRWINDRYRRAALRELQLLEAALEKPEKRDSSLRQLPTLLKRTALSAYPRSQVASLTGKDWYTFLNSKVQTPLFSAASATTLENISYSVGPLTDIDTQASMELISAGRLWMKQHQAFDQSKNSGET